LLGAFLLFGPLLFRLIWPTSRLGDGPLRDRLEALSARTGFRCRDVLLWRTGHHVANAAVVGLVPWLRYVLLSDLLVSNCTPQELEAIFAHELGHARRHHLAFYALFALAFMGLYACVVDLLAQAGWVSPLRSVAAYELTMPQAMLMSGFAVLYWVFAFGYLSRRLERQADLYSVEVSSEPRALISALRKLSLLSGVPPTQRSWRHFSTAARVEFLGKVLRQPELARHALRRVTLLKLAAVLLFGVALVRVLGEFIA